MLGEERSQESAEAREPCGGSRGESSLHGEGKVIFPSQVYWTAVSTQKLLYHKVVGFTHLPKELQQASLSPPKNPYSDIPWIWKLTTSTSAIASKSPGDATTPTTIPTTTTSRLCFEFDVLK